MDRSGADYFRVIDQIKARLGCKAVPMQLPIGLEDSFEGVIDLIKMKAIYWEASNMGMTFVEKDIPLDLQEISFLWRERLVEVAAEASEYLLDKYLSEIKLTNDEIIFGIRKLTLENKIVPAYCGSAFKNKGVQALLDAIVQFLPAPIDVKAIEGVLDDEKTKEARMASDDEPFSALAFKIASDSFVGNLAFFRVYSGVLNSGDVIYNSVKKRKERIGRIVQMHANSREEVKKVFAGDIAAAIGMKDVTTGDTLCDLNNIIVLERMDFPDPVISVAVEAKTKGDQDKMSLALAKLSQEDPSFRVHSDDESGQIIISGMGELHLEIIVDRMKREFNVAASVGAPQVAYRETVLKSVEHESKFIRQSGGRGQYGHVCLRIEPRKTGAGYLFVNEVVGGVVPKEFIPAVDKGIQEQLKSGILAGYPVLDVKVSLFDGSYHEVDSSEIAFKIAGSMCFREGARKASPVLLEPIMKVEISTPEEYMGDVVGDLNRRRGIIHGMDDTPSGKTVSCEVPLAEMFGYATDLRSATQGRATYSMQFEKYNEAPANIAEAIIKKSS